MEWCKARGHHQIFQEVRHLQCHGRGTEDNAIFEQSDSSSSDDDDNDDDDDELAGIAEGLTRVDIYDDSDEEFNDE